MDIEKANELLTRQIELSLKLDGKEESSPEFQKWKRDTEIVLEKIFGGKSRHLPDLRRISFSPGVYYSGMPADAGSKRCRAGLSEAREILRSMIQEISDYGLDVSGAETVPDKPDKTMRVTDSKTVFVVHGRNTAKRDAMFGFLRAIGLNPLEWSQAVRATGEATPYVGHVLDKAFTKAQAVVVLMTPDDEACLRNEFQTERDEQYEKQLTPQARPNVLFEAGMAMGRDAKRTVLVEIGKLRPFSDVVGRHILRLDDSTQRRQELADRLKTAGCEVNLSGTDWHTAGSFRLDENPKITPSNAKQKETRLDETTEKILKYIFDQACDLSAPHIASVFKMKQGVADFHLNELAEKEFIYWNSLGFAGTFGEDPEPPKFSIHSEGQKYIVRNGLAD